MEEADSRYSYINELAKQMMSLNVYLAVTYLPDNADLLEVADTMKIPGWGEQSRESTSPVVGTLLVLAGTYGLTSTNTLQLSGTVQRAISEIREAFDGGHGSPAEHRCLRIIHGMDGLGLTDVYGKDAERERAA